MSGTGVNADIMVPGLLDSDGQQLAELRPKLPKARCQIPVINSKTLTRRPTEFRFGGQLDRNPYFLARHRNCSPRCMPSRTLQGLALTLTALGLAPGAAHLMELPVKLAYSQAMYAEVTSTLYVWYGLAGGTVQVVATLAVTVLAFQVRTLAVGRLAAASAAALLASLLIWGLVVAPVNSTWAEIASAGPAEIVTTYGRLRSRWEFGHVAAFAAWLAGWLGLVAAVTRPQARNAESAT